MAQIVSLELPDGVIRRAADVAERAGRPIEAVLTEWLEWIAISQQTSDFLSGGTYPIYTPYDNEAAAQGLQDALDAERPAEHHIYTPLFDENGDAARSLQEMLDAGSDLAKDQQA